MNGICIGAAEPIGAALKIDIIKFEKAYIEPIGEFARCLYMTLFLLFFFLRKR